MDRTSKPVGRRWAVLLFLCGLFVFYVWIDLVWHAIDRRPPRWDESHSLMISQHAFQALQQGRILTALSLKGISNTKPGLVCFLSAISYFLMGDSPVVATMLVNGLAVLTILYVLLRGGSDLFGSAAVGAVAFLLFCNTRSVLIWTGYYQTDLALTAAVCATVWLCWAIDRCGFANKGRPLLLALSMVIGLGSKHLFPLFVAGPLALLVCRALIRRGPPFRISFRGRGYLLAGLGIGIVLGVFYHLLNFHIIREQLARSKDAALTGGIGSPTQAWEVLSRLICFLPTTVWCVLLAFSSLLAVAMRQWRVIYILLCIIGGYLGVGYVASWPMPYYFLPMVPLGFLAACGFLGLPVPVRGVIGKTLKAGRTLVLVVLMVMLLLEYSMNRLGTRNLARVAWQTPRVLAAFGHWTESPVADDQYWRQTYVDGNLATLPYPHDWPVAEFLETAANAQGECSSRRPLLILYFTGAYEWMTDEFARYQIKRMRHEGTLQISQLFAFPADQTPSQVLADYDFVILKTGQAMKNDCYGATWAEGYQSFVNQLTGDDYAVLRNGDFRLLQRCALPDGSEASLWLALPRSSQTQ